MSVSVAKTCNTLPRFSFTGGGKAGQGAWGGVYCRGRCGAGEEDTAGGGDVAGECETEEEHYKEGNVSAREEQAKESCKWCVQVEETLQGKTGQGRAGGSWGRTLAGEGGGRQGRQRRGRGLGVARACEGVTPLAPGLKAFRDVIAVIKIYRS